MKLQHCNKAHIYTLQEERICDADVMGDVENDTATLRFHEFPKDILQAEVVVKFLDNTHGLVSCVCRFSDNVEEVVDEEDNLVITTVQCVITAQQEVIQRRQDVKVSVQIQTSASFLDKNNNLQTADITILDISAGGMFCLSEQQWSENQVFAAKIFDKSFPIDVEVLRVQTAHAYSSDYPETDLRYGYGCRFINLSTSSESALRKFVYQQEVQRRRARR